MSSGHLKLKALLIAFGLTCLIACSKPEDVTRLMKQLDEGNTSQRSDAALQLGRIGSPLANRAVPDLIAMLNERNTGIQSSAAYALRKIDTPAAREALAAKSRR